MRKKKLVSLLAAAVLVIAAGFGARQYFDTHIFLEGHIYPRNAVRLDLRGTEISAGHYESLRSALPDCEILWDVPFQGSFYPEDTRSLTVAALTDSDAALLDYFPMLETLNAEECRDYAQLAAVKARFPSLDVRYRVLVDGQAYPQDTRELVITNITDQEISLLQYLPMLRTINAEECTDLSRVMRLRQQYPHCSLSWVVPIGSETFAGDTAELMLTGASLDDLAGQLAYLPQLRKVSLIDPVGSAESLLALPEAYPEVEFFWQMEFLGVSITSEDLEADLSGIPMESLEPVEAAMAFFPKAEKVILSGCGIDNETMAAFREKMRAEYKVVWSVEVGYLTVRTDETWYMPGKYNLGVTDEQAYNLRYCEDMICIDVGHKPVSNCEWAAFMPNLKYLILADTAVTDLTPLTGLEHLIYLEIFITKVKDYSPLLTCTALEDLNLCYTYGDPAPVQQMTWLKRLWWADCPIDVEEFQEYLPDTQLMFLHHSSTGNGWRQGQNYYDMRNILGMHIMWG